MIRDFEIHFADPAEADLRDLYDFLVREASPRSAEAYIDRLLDFADQLRLFPERGTKRDEIKQGLRTIGFERRVSIAFIVEENKVVVLRVLYAGREIRLIE